MENKKVTKLVKKFENSAGTRYSGHESYLPQDKISRSQKNDIVFYKKQTPQGLDEISVTIDIVNDANENGKDKLKHLRSSPILSNIESSKFSKDNEFRNKDDDEEFTKKYNPLYQSQTNLAMMPIWKKKEFDLNEPLSHWLSDNVYRPLQTVPSPKLSKRRTVATDTFELDRRREEEIRIFKENIDDLGCQLKIKDREIETNKWIEKEMQRRLQSTGDVFALKNQVKELQRNVDIQERLNQDLASDNSRLYDELSNKDRAILELQSEINNLDKVVASTKYLMDQEEKKKHIDDLDKLQMELLKKDHEINDVNQRLAALQRELEKKDKEINVKNMKLEESYNEVEQYQNDLINLQRENLTNSETVKVLERENNKLRENLIKMEEYEGKWQKLEDENIYLKQTLEDTEDQYRLLEKKYNSSHQTNALAEELRQALTEKNRTNDERTHLLDRLRFAESTVREQKAEQRSLVKENEKLKDFVKDLEDENALYRKFEKEVEEIGTHLRESERSRNALESQLIQLKPKIQRLQVKSLEKDHLITQLVQELKSQIGYLPADLKKEISKNDVGSTRSQNKDHHSRGQINPPEIYLNEDEYPAHDK